MAACTFAFGEIGVVAGPRPPLLRYVGIRQWRSRARAGYLVSGTWDRCPTRDRCSSHICRTWQEAVSESGQVYFWNTVTMETSWELPPPAEQSAQPGTGPSTVSISSEASLSQQDMLQRLSTALESDPTGMRFAEEARSLRSSGVFEDAYFDFLTDSIEAASSEAHRALIEKLRARLCNPLLRQAAPYE